MWTGILVTAAVIVVSVAVLLWVVISAGNEMERFP